MTVSMLSRSGLAALGILWGVHMSAQGRTGIVERADAGGAAPKTPAGAVEAATFGMGCFWCAEAVFETVPGVKSVTSGYQGGDVANPTYKQVCGGKTGHAEVIRIEFDPRVVTYEALLDLFWRTHDPTTLNRQGADEGTQYRSVIFCHSEQQRRQAEKSRIAAAAAQSRPIVTEIVTGGDFYRAEEYHQDYFRKNPQAPYCRVVIAPKLEKMRQNAR